jgi:predicted RNase H-like HicB family nuclease
MMARTKTTNQAQEQTAAGELPPYSMRIDWDPDDRIFVVTVPELAGCMTHGATYEEAARNGREAIASWVGAARKFGDEVPGPRVVRHLLDEDEARELTGTAR